MSEVTADQAAEATQEAGTPPAQEPAAKQSTSYVVLAKDADKDWWAAQGNYTAASAKAAVAAHVKAKDARAGTFIAVPERSWKPLTLAVETETKVKLT